MKMAPTFWGMIAAPLWGGFGIWAMALLAAFGLTSVSLIELLGVALGTALILRMDFTLRPPGMPGLGYRAPAPGLLIGALLAGLGVAILGSEIDNIVRDRVPLVFTAPTPEQANAGAQMVAGPAWAAALSQGLVVPVARALVASGIALRNLVAGLPWRVALAVSAIAFSFTSHEHPAYWLPLTLAPLIGGWAYLRSHCIWLPIAVAIPQHAASFLAVANVRLGIPGFDSPSGPIAEFQPFWFDALGLALILAGGALLIRGFEAGGLRVPAGPSPGAPGAPGAPGDSDRADGDDDGPAPPDGRG